MSIQGKNKKRSNPNCILCQTVNPRYPEEEARKSNSLAFMNLYRGYSGDDAVGGAFEFSGQNFSPINIGRTFLPQLRGKTELGKEEGRKEEGEKKSIFPLLRPSIQHPSNADATVRKLRIGLKFSIV